MDIDDIFIFTGFMDNGQLHLWFHEIAPDYSHKCSRLFNFLLEQKNPQRYNHRIYWLISFARGSMKKRSS